MDRGTTHPAARLEALLADELRGGWLNVPRAYSLLDFLGAALGSYFLWAGATGRAPRWSLAAIGGIMIFIHTQRFFYAPQSADGLRRLVAALDLQPEEVRAALRLE